MKPTQHERIVNMLRLAGDKGLHSKDFMESYLPAFSQRIGELRNRGYTIRSVPEAFPHPMSEAVGRRYFLEGEPPKPRPVPVLQVPVPESPEVQAHGGTVDFNRLFPLPRPQHPDAA